MRYQRSKTAMDDVSLQTPATQLNMGRLAAYMRENVDTEANIGLRTRGLLSGLDDGGVPDGTGSGSFLGAYYSDPNLMTVDASNEGPVDGGRTMRLGSLGQEVGFGSDVLSSDVPDYSYDVGYPTQPAADAALPSTAPGASSGGGTWNWQSLMDKAPAMLRDLMLATSSADYQYKLTQINLDRAKKGQPPLAAGQYAPMVQVGVAPQTLKIAGIGAGTFLAVAIASAFGFAALMKRKRA